MKIIEAKKYEETGLLFPINVVGVDEKKWIRKDFELAENVLADNPISLSLLRSNVAQLFPLFDKLICNENLVAVATAVLGPDLIVWSSGMFIKEASSPKIVYEGTDSIKESDIN